MNCKPGDLAYITRSKIPENVGRIVEVLRAAPEFSARYGEPHWRCKAVGPMRVEGGWLDVEAHVADSRLRPISGVPVHEEQRDEVPA